MNNYPLIKAEIILDTISDLDAQITTFEITYPRPILAEVNTHGVVAKSTASSRAIPIAKRRADMQLNPYVPIFTKNKKGMQADEILDAQTAVEARALWIKHLEHAAETSELLEKMDTHKQHANRVLEPFLYTKTVITGTEWRNFFKLRNSKAAQPEFEELAFKMQWALNASQPKAPVVIDGHEYHLPYVEPDEIDWTENDDYTVAGRALNVSSARCARVSYKSLVTGKRSTWEEDSVLSRNLMDDGHMSPFDHPAIADTASRTDKYRAGNVLYSWDNAALQGRFYGWIPYRNDLERLLGASRRSPLEPFTLPLKTGF